MQGEPAVVLDESAFLRGGGEMGRLIRGFDWAATALGAPARWPLPLRTAVRLMLTTNHPIFLFWGESGICLYNDAYSRSLGPEKHPAMLGAVGREAWAEIWDAIGPQIEFVMSGQGATWHENQLLPIVRHGRRDDVYWTYSYSPVDEPSAARGVGGVLVLCTETTGQVLAAERLRAAEGRWRRLFDQAPGFACVLAGREHVFEFANPAYFALVGRSDILGTRVIDSMPWAREQGFIDLLDAVYATGQPHVELTAPLVVPGASGVPAATRYIDFVYQPVRDESGAVSGIFVLGSEVTERMAAQAALSDSEERLRIARDAADLGIYDFDLASGRMHWDARTRALWGFDADEPVTYDAALACIHPDDRPRVVAQVQQACDPACDGRYAGEYRVIDRRDGTLRWIAATGHVTVAAGAAVRMVGTVTDITERRQAETRRNEFLATLGHELRNPLAPIANSLHVLERQPNLQDAARKAHAVIDRQLKHMVRLLEDLLDVVRITNGRIELRTEVVALDEVLELALEAAAPQVERGGHQLVVSAPPRPLHVRADRVRLSQVFSNLIVNASKYSDAGSRIEVAIQRADSNRVAVHVRDRGIGIDAPYLARVFEMFSQAEPSLSRSQGGLGIGLSLAKGLTELHGGTIEVHSEGLGQGSEFTVRLPALDDAGDPGPASCPEAPARSPLAGLRVLVVDDNHDAAASLAGLLEIDGATLAVAGDGVEALRRAQTFAPALVLLDIGLPGMNGYEVCRALRARPGGAALRVIALTGWGQNSDRERTREAGFDAHLVKPVDYEALLRAIGAPADLATAPR